MPENIRRAQTRDEEMRVPPLLNKSLDTVSLTEKEEAIIQAVLQKDDLENRILNTKISELRREIQEIRKVGALNADDNQNSLCARCKFKFPPFIFPWTDHGQRCVTCKFRVCTRCSSRQANGSWLCILCEKYRQEKLLTGEWMTKGQPVGLHGSELLRALLRERCQTHRGYEETGGNNFTQRPAKAKDVDTESRTSRNSQTSSETKYVKKGLQKQVSSKQNTSTPKLSTKLLNIIAGSNSTHEMVRPQHYYIQPNRPRATNSDSEATDCLEHTVIASPPSRQRLLGISSLSYGNSNKGIPSLMPWDTDKYFYLGDNSNVLTYTPDVGDHVTQKHCGDDQTKAPCPFNFSNISTYPSQPYLSLSSSAGQDNMDVNIENDISGRNFYYGDVIPVSHNLTRLSNHERKLGSSLSSDICINQKSRSPELVSEMSDLELFRKRGARYSQRRKRQQEDKADENVKGLDEERTEDEALSSHNWRRMSLRSENSWIPHWHEILRRRSVVEMLTKTKKDCTMASSPTLCIIPPNDSIFHLVKPKLTKTTNIKDLNYLTPKSPGDDLPSSQESISVYVEAVKEYKRRYTDTQRHKAHGYSSPELSPTLPTSKSHSQVLKDTLVLTPSPDISLRSVTPDITIRSVSPDISIRSVSPDVTTKSGPDINKRSASPDINIKSLSLDISKRSTCLDTSIRSASPDISIRSMHPDINRRSVSPGFIIRSASPDISMRSGSPDINMKSGSSGINMRSASPDISMRSGSPDISMRSTDLSTSLRENYCGSLDPELWISPDSKPNLTNSSLEKLTMRYPSRPKLLRSKSSITGRFFRQEKLRMSCYDISSSYHSQVIGSAEKNKPGGKPTLLSLALKYEEEKLMQAVKSHKIFQVDSVPIATVDLDAELKDDHSDENNLADVPENNLADVPQPEQDDQSNESVKDTNRDISSKPINQTNTAGQRDRSHKSQTDQFSVPSITVINLGGESLKEEDDDLDDLFANRLSNQLLGSRNSLADSRESVCSVYSDAGEVNHGRIPVTGEIMFGLHYNHQTSTLKVHVKQCKDLAPVDPKHNKSDPYVKTYLLPDNTRSGKRKTRIKKHTLNPIFDEILEYNVTSAELEYRTLSLTVWHNDRFGRNDFLGEVTLPLSYYRFDSNVPLWYSLQERTTIQETVTTYKGELFISLKYVPADMVEIAPKKKSSSLIKKNKEKEKPLPVLGEVHVLVSEAQNLTVMRSSAGSNPFCKGYLLPHASHASKQKTPIIKKTTNPKWQHILVFEGVDQAQLHEYGLELTIWDHEKLSSNDFLGGVRLNLGQGIHQGRLVDWMDARGEETEIWQNMIDHPNEWVDAQLPLRASMGKQNERK